MNSANYREEKIYLKKEDEIQQEALNTIKDAIAHNNAVGTLVGFYDEALTIISVSDYLLNNLEYDSVEKFNEFTQGSLKKIFVSENTYWLEKERFRKIHGKGEGVMLTADGTPIHVRLYKNDSVDIKGNPIWILAVRVDWELENLALVNEAIKSGPWYIDFDKNGNVREVNWSHAFRTMLGFHDTNDFPNVLESWSDLIHPDDKDMVLKRLNAAIEDKTGEVKYDVEYRMKMVDESYQWHRAVGEGIRRMDGSLRRIAGVFININKEKNGRMQIQRANAFHKAFTRSNLCEYYLDIKDNSFESLKTDESILTKYEQNNTWDGLVNILIDFYVCDEYKENVRHFYNREYIVKQFNGEENELILEYMIIIDNESRWIRSVIMREDEDRPCHAMIFLRDVTNAKKEDMKRRKMIEDNETMEHLIRSMVRVVDHFAICDLDTDNYEYHNINVDSRYPEKGRYSDFIRCVTATFKTLKPLEEMIDCLSCDNLRAQIKTAVDIYKFEYCSMDEDIFRIASFVPLEWKDNVLKKVLWISMDITAEKRNEIESRNALKDAFNAAERANKAKTEFLANMSHDIRTPMNAIVGLTALAGANIQHNDRVIECLSKITKSSRHLLALINEVLDMARIESGKVSLADEEFDMSELVDNLITMIQPDIDEHKHHFEVNINHIEHEAVYGDSLRIQQVFVNFMSNAIKYTPDGGNITFSIEEKPNGFSELGCFEFVIEDDGVGMTKEFQEVMFQPFVRADDTRSTKIQGTGLGMSIARNIVNMMNGSIDVESEPGKGTKVIVTIYLRLRNQKKDKLKEFAKLPVLVVDDDVLSCESTVSTLEEIGIAGEWVTSGEKAVSKVLDRHKAAEDYFAIIMDWKMPGMDGIEATRKIRKIVGREVTIIVLTAYDYSEIEEEAKEAGVDAFILKPLFRSRLTATLNQIVTGKTDIEANNYLSDIAESDYSGKRVLLVEDNDLNREIAAEIIGMAKVSVDVARNGQEAVEKIEEMPDGYYNLVFMDIQMPVMNGYEATAAIRALGKKGMVPIVAMTANAFAEDVQMAKNTGMNGHIAKPLDMEKLNNTLKKWL